MSTKKTKHLQIALCVSGPLAGEYIGVNKNTETYAWGTSVSNLLRYLNPNYSHAMGLGESGLREEILEWSSGKRSTFRKVILG